MLDEDRLREEAEEDAGMLLHLIHRMCDERMRSTVPNRAFPIDALRWSMNEEGNPQPWITVQMENGVKIAVLVAPLPVA